MYFAKTNVSAGKSGKGIRLPDFAPNQRIPDDHFSDEHLAALIKKGAVSEFASGEVTEDAATAKATVDRALWTYRAEDLKDVGLDALNTMAAQHVEEHGIAKVEPFEDRDEAIAWMTKDFVAEQD